MTTTTYNDICTGGGSALKGYILTPLHNINRQNVMANKFILGRLAREPTLQSTYVNTIIGDYW